MFDLYVCGVRGVVCVRCVIYTFTVCGSISTTPEGQRPHVALAPVVVLRVSVRALC